MFWVIFLLSPARNYHLPIELLRMPSLLRNEQKGDTQHLLRTELKFIKIPGNKTIYHYNFKYKDRRATSGEEVAKSLLPFDENRKKSL